MDAGFTSTFLINSRIRGAAASMQTELSQRQSELASGKKFDAGLELGSLSEHLVQFKRQIQTIEQTRTANDMLSNRMGAMQDAMTAMVSSMQHFSEQMVAGAGSALDRNLAEQLASGAIQQFAGLANTSYRGEYLFSGINTDVPALNDYSGDAGQAARTAVQAAFETEFGFPVSDAQAAGIDEASMTAFLEGAYADLFSDSNWQSLWSGASSRGMRLKYSVSQVAELPVTANEGAMRQAMAGMVAVFEFAGSALNDQTMAAVSKYALGKASQSISSTVELQGQLGVFEEKASDAKDRMEFQENLLKHSVSELEDADSYETASRINELLVKLEASYSVTARIQSLSILNFI